jgi:hypothetical protein
MRPHDPKNTTRPTKYVGGAGHWNKRGNPKPKGKK